MLEHYPFIRLLTEEKTHKNNHTANSGVDEVLFVMLSVFSIVYWPYSLVNKLDYSMLLLWLLMLGFLISLAITNHRNRLLKNNLVYPFMLIVVIYQLLNSINQSDAHILLNSFLGGLVVGGIPYLLFQFSKGRWIGFGNVRLGLAVGLLVSVKFSVLCVILFSLIVVLMILIAYLNGKFVKTRTYSANVTTGFAWMIVAVTCQLFGQRIIDLL